MKVKYTPYIECLLLALQIRKLKQGSKDYRIVYEQTLQLVKDNRIEELQKILEGIK